jgi:serpin B
MRPGEVSVSMPKFRFERSYDLPEHLKALGMVDAFDQGRADFSGMADSSLSIGAVAHKAFIEVNEEGTEAAAATAVVMITSGPPRFYIDHPFLLLIRDTKHGTILFMGRVMNPKE